MPVTAYLNAVIALSVDCGSLWIALFILAFVSYVLVQHVPAWYA